MSQCGMDGPLFSRRGGCGRAPVVRVRRGAVVHELELVEAGVEAAALEELVVRALLAQLAAVEDEDAVGVLDGGEAMGDDDGGAAAHEGVERMLDLALERGVDGAGGLVEDEDERVEGERAGEGEELALADGEGGAALADGLGVAAGELLDEAVGADAGGGGADADVVDVVAAEANVVGDVAAEEEHVLEHEADAAAQLVERDAVDGHAVEQDLSALRLVEPHEQVDEGGLSGAGVADDGDALARARAEADAAEDPLPRSLPVPVRRRGGVGEPDVAELDLAAAAGGEVERGVGLGGGGLRVEQVEDALGGGHRALEHVVLLGQ